MDENPDYGLNIQLSNTFDKFIELTSFFGKISQIINNSINKVWNCLYFSNKYLRV